MQFIEETNIYYFYILWDYYQLTNIYFYYYGIINNERRTITLQNEKFRCTFTESKCMPNDEQFYELYSKFKDVIEDTNYNIDIVDCLTMLHCAMEDFEMYA